MCEYDSKMFFASNQVNEYICSLQNRFILTLLALLQCYNARHSIVILQVVLNQFINSILSKFKFYYSNRGYILNQNNPTYIYDDQENVDVMTSFVNSPPPLNEK